MTLLMTLVPTTTPREVHGATREAHVVPETAEIHARKVWMIALRNRDGDILIHLPLAAVPQ
jgi:hypothetical protein